MSPLRVLLCLMLMAPAPALAAETPPTPAEIAGRVPYVETIAKLRRITTPDGVEALRQVRLGGVPQWISVRGRHRDNPLLLFIHGGPGTPNMPLAWAYQTGWEEYFTVVQWEQRGVGRNWSATAAAEKPPVSLDRLVADASELVDELRAAHGKRKLVVLGFSYGTEIGARLALKRPDAVSAYVGMGQVYGGTEADAWAGALAAAKAQGDAEAIAGLAAMAPYPAADGKASMAGIREVRRWIKRLGGAWHGWPDLELLYRLPLLSPDYGAADLAGWPASSSWFGSQLLPGLLDGSTLPDQSHRFDMPVFLFMGRHDLMTPHATAQRYFARIEAPAKRFETFEDSAHFPMLEEPGRFLVALVTHVRPHALAAEAETPAAR